MIWQIKKPGLVAGWIKPMSKWWDDTYPEMIAMGGDAGNPDEGRQAAKKSSNWKGKTSDKVRTPVPVSLYSGEDFWAERRRDFHLSNRSAIADSAPEVFGR